MNYAQLRSKRNIHIINPLLQPLICDCFLTGRDTRRGVANDKQPEKAPPPHFAGLLPRTAPSLCGSLSHIAGRLPRIIPQKHPAPHTLRVVFRTPTPQNPLRLLYCGLSSHILFPIRLFSRLAGTIFNSYNIGGQWRPFLFYTTIGG